MSTTVTRAHPRLIGARLISMVIASLLGSVVMAFAPALPVAAASETPTRTASTFELRPDAGLVHATVVYKITNRIPCTATACYYVNGGEIGVDPAGTNFRASTPGGVAHVSVKAGKEGFLSTAKFTYPATFRGTTRTVTITYDVPGGKPRSGAETRVGQAYSRFCGYPGFGYIGDQASFSLVVPKRYAVSQVIGDTLKQTTTGNNSVLASTVYTAKNDGLAHGVCVEAVDAGKLSETNHQAAADLTVRVQAWPEDATWLASVSDAVTNVLGKLEDKIGIAPHTKAIILREVVAETLGGYAASYSSEESLTRVSEEALQSLVVTHELAHAWFDETFSTETWLTEGYAEYFARSLAASSAGLGPCQPAADTSVILSRWFFLPALPTDADQQKVAAYYEDACAILTMVGDKIGDAKMTEIVVAAFNGEIAYLGSGPAEKTRTGPLTWQEWLDLVDERGLARISPSNLDWLQQVLIEYGVSSASDPTGRSPARAHYHALLTRLGTWSSPFAIRDQMAKWAWDNAEKSMSTADAIFDARDKAVASVPELKDSNSVPAAFGAAKDQAALEAVLALASKEADAAARVAAAKAAAVAGRGPIEAVGLIGQNLGTDAAAAVATLVKGDDAKAVTQAAAVAKTAADATTSGAIRLGGAGVLVLGGAGGVFLWRRRRGSGGPGGEPVAVATTDVATAEMAAPVDPMPSAVEDTRDLDG